MSKVNVAGLLVDNLRKQDVVSAVLDQIREGQKVFIITPYSEFLYRGLKNPEILQILNRANFSIADGISLLWASHFLALPLTLENYYLKIAQCLWQMASSLSKIVLSPKRIRSEIPEKIVGADFFWDIVRAASAKDYSIFLLGGFQDTPEKVKNLVLQKFPNVRIIGASNKDANDNSIVSDIIIAKPDFLFVAFGPIKQEMWIAKNFESLPIKLAVGLGGTFDYIAGKQFSPPRFIRKSGFEWLFRLVTQPHRFKRIFQATFGLLLALLRYKVFMSCPYRRNVVGVVINKNNELLLCQRNPRSYNFEQSDKFINYWQFPQGGVDNKESIVDAARREIKEETGLGSLELITVSKIRNRYIWNNARRSLLFNKLKNRGQEQNIVYFRLQGENLDVKIDQEEFIAYKWVKLQDLQEVIHPERLQLQRIVENDLIKLFHN